MESEGACACETSYYDDDEKPPPHTLAPGELDAAVVAPVATKAGPTGKRLTMMLSRKMRVRQHMVRSAEMLPWLDFSKHLASKIVFKSTAYQQKLPLSDTPLWSVSSGRLLR